MRHTIIAIFALFIPVSFAHAQPREFNVELQDAAAKVEKVLPACAEQVDKGDISGANKRLLETFPEANRTTTQSFVLANLLFEMDRTTSYRLHKAAVDAEPDNPMLVWEWGMEQHRAGEYAAALKSYQAFSKSDPNSAYPYALEADCLLRLNRIDEAVVAWKKSEDASDGSIEQMENLVCAIHRMPAPFARRAELLAKVVRQKDVEAAADLIALDCDFENDWWNGGPNSTYLDNDMPAIAAALKLPATDVRFRAMACAAECATADHDDGDAVAKILIKHRLLIDDEKTVPSHGGLLSAIVVAATESNAIDKQILNEQIAPKVLELARKGADAKLWNVAAFLSPEAKAPQQIQLERDGWKATGDPRFAAGVLYWKLEMGQLNSNDVDLVAALKQFPENGLIQRAAYEVARKEDKVTSALLAACARAEFTHFTSFVAPATVVNRPRSDYLRGYFKLLEKIRSIKKQADE